MTTDATIIFHGNCPDGFTGAWLMHRYLTSKLKLRGKGVVRLHAASYGEAPPQVHGQHVFLVDFCYEPEHLVELHRQSSTLTILDHHATAMEWVTEVWGDSVVTDWDPDLKRIMDIKVLDQEHSGAMLAMLWTGLHHTFVKYVEDRDLWRFRYGSNTHDAFAMITSFDYTLQNWDDLSDMGIQELLDGGAAINRYRDNLIQQVVKQAYQDRVLGHDDIWVVAAPYAIGSDVAGELAKRDPDRFAAYYVDQPDEVRRWGLRSGPEGMDVAKLAATRGGGGHVHASGFETPRESSRV